MASCASLVEKSGMILPLIDGEQDWPDALRAVLYVLGMIYFFLGVSIIADTFVASIEVVTARRRKVKQKSGKTFTVRVWNDTVATLSLMALGSSAPEIALSVIDLFKNKFLFAPLGAQTIVGSAAFNLLVIVAVCIVVVPSTEVRLIRELPAFYVTAAISLFAYVWLVLILVVISPDVVEIWEAACTFAFLPMLIFVSYQVDIRDLGGTRAPPPVADDGGLGTIVEEKPTFYLDFESDDVTVDANETGQLVQVTVKRQGSNGRCTCSFRTELYSAMPGYDFMDAEGTLEFAPGQMHYTFPIEIIQRQPNHVARQLLVILEGMEGETEFNPETDGGADGAILTITIAASPGSSGIKRCLDRMFNLNHLRRGMAEWSEQWSCCAYCNGSAEEQQDATVVDWILHCTTLPWKMLFSLCPPTSLFGGWACFIASLAFIGVLTAWISDLAELFGFVLGICDDVTALVFVALGTSMPDLFASLTAAREEPTADASIVNVTGSNSVNVFLGLGLPWTIGAIYWAVAGRTDSWNEKYGVSSLAAGLNGGAAFVVEAQNLGFCVLIFSCACLIALFIIHLRRKCVGCELGGNLPAKVASFVALITLWVGFLGLSSWKVMRWEQASLAEQILVLVFVGVCSMITCLVSMLIIVRQGRKLAKEGRDKEEALYRPSNTGAFGGDHRKKKSERSRDGANSEDRSSDHDSQASMDRQKILKKAPSSDSFASCFSSKNGIQVSI